MAGHFDDEVHPFQCTCGHKFSKTTREIKAQPDFKCPACGRDITVSPPDMEKADKSVDDLFDAFGEDITI